MTAWHKAYRDAGLTIIGIHSPEYAFEKAPRNVEAGARSFGIGYPVALDNNLSTWTNYRNRYWPAHYLIDADGVVRHLKFGEGDWAIDFQNASRWERAASVSTTTRARCAWWLPERAP